MKDKIAVVTGASQGIGEAVARRFAAAGTRLVLSDLTDEVIPKAQEIALFIGLYICSWMLYSWVELF